VNPWLLTWAVTLLSVERFTYAVVWHAPDAFRQWSSRGALARAGDPTDVLALLFVAFKGLQILVFLTWCAVHSHGNLKPYSPDLSVLLFGAILIAAGQTLNVSVFRVLGKAGVFYGNRLGHSVPWRRTFPFTWFEHPQYVGAVLSIWGFFVLMRFPADDWLVIPVIETVYYALGAFFERDTVPRDDIAARS